MKTELGVTDVLTFSLLLDVSARGMARPGKLPARVDDLLEDAKGLNLNRARQRYRRNQKQ